MIPGSSLVALFLVVAIAFWLFVRKRHGDLKVPNPKALSNGPELRGVGGWLRAYILLAYIGVPIIGIMHGMPITVNSTHKTSPCLPAG